MSCWLGIDVGTSGIKALVMNESGEVIRKGYAEQDVIFSQPGYAEQDPSVWWQSCKDAVRAALNGSEIGDRIEAIGFSGQMQGTVFLDEKGQPVRNCIIWMDQRAVNEVKDIEGALGEARMDADRITANQCLTTFWAPKILWVKKHEPQNYSRIKKVVFAKDYLAYCMTGEIATEVSDASLTYLLDIPGRRWSDDMFRALDIPREIVPDRLLESCDVTGRLRKSVADELGLKPGIPVIAGGGDQAANGIGTGIIDESIMGASIGTSAVVFGCSKTPFFDTKKRAIQSLCHSAPDLWAYLGLSLTAGASLKWVRDVIFPREKQECFRTGQDIYDHITGIAAKAAPGSGGLIFLPYFNGDSAPNNDPNARACFFGMSLNTGMPELCRSVMEGITFSLRETIEVCRETGKDIKTIRVSGGGAKSLLWRQMQADIFQTSIVTMNIEEGPAAGAAIMAAVGSGFFKDVAEGCGAVLRTSTETQPIAENVKKYDEYFWLYHEMYGHLRESFAKRARLISSEI
ncbi:MAG TPA: xylulokinase [Bacillota bacterium]|nr:xylulokinase [Bacillota bacterium]